MKVQQWLPVVLPGASEAPWRPGGGLEEDHPEEKQPAQRQRQETTAGPCVCVHSLISDFL